MIFLKNEAESALITETRKTPDFTLKKTADLISSLNICFLEFMKTAGFFSDQNISYHILRERAFNLRWAMVPEGVIPLTAADPDFPCAPPIIEAINRFSSSGYFCYGPAEGYDFFRESVSRFFIEKRNAVYKPANILAVDSAAAGIYMTCRAILKPGDEAIVFDPVDFLFRHSVEACGGISIPFPVPFGPGEAIDFSILETLAGPKTRLLCLCNPLNPTGKVFTVQELKQLHHFAEKKNLIILSDEIWSDIVFEPARFTSIASLHEDAFRRTITITGFSKSYGLAGLRIGAVLCPDENWFKQILDASGHLSTVSGSNSLGQVAATAALDECQSWLAEFILHLQLMRDKIVTGLNALPGITCESPDGCYLVFPNIIGTGLQASDLQQKLLNEAKVAVVPGLPKWFGDRAEGHIRLCFATSSVLIDEAMNRLNHFFSTGR